jgi:protein involved in polysaccharide export with SLBB domain
MRWSLPGTLPSPGPAARWWIALTVLLAAAGATLAGERKVVNAGNVLEISVAGHPELGRLRTVGTTGGIWVPRLGEVPVAGLTPDSVAGLLSDLFARQDTTRRRITVRLVDDSPAVVTVAGAVARPGVQNLEKSRRLIDVLLAAGGLTAEATRAVIVERREGTFADGTAVWRLHLPPGEPTAEVLAALATPLARGDVVTAPAADPVIAPDRVAQGGPF